MPDQEASRRKKPRSKFKNAVTNLLSKPEVRNWLDIGNIAVGILALYGALTTDSPALQNLLPEVVSGTGLAALLSAIDRIKGLSTQRLERINQGMEPMSRDGELILALGGKGHVALDSLARLGTKIVPVFDDENGANQIKTWIKNNHPDGYSLGKKPEEAIQTPYFVNLAVKDNPELTSSTNYDLINFKPENILTTDNRQKKFVTFGIGATFDQCLLKLPSSGVSPEYHNSHHQFFQDQAILQGALTSDDESVMIMVDDGTRLSNQLSEFGSIHNVFPRERFFLTENRIWIDITSTVFKSIRKQYLQKGRLPVYFETSNPNFLKNLSIDSLGWDWQNNPNLPKKSEFYKDPDRTIQIIFEENDESTLELAEKRFSNIKVEYIALLRSEEAQLRAEKLHIKSACVATILRDEVNRAYELLREGKSVDQVQASLDEIIEVENKTTTVWRIYSEANKQLYGGDFKK